MATAALMSKAGLSTDYSKSDLVLKSFTDPTRGLAPKTGFSSSRKRGFAWEYAVDPRTRFEYIMRVIAWQHLCMSGNAGDGFSSVGYAQNDVLWFHGLSENWGFEREVVFRGEEVFNVLATRVDTGPESEASKRAYRIVRQFSTKSSIQKITHRWI
jgi:hypothetical protein